MNILIIMNPGIPVPPLKYGGIERIVHLLANAYQQQGHRVTLLAGPESACNGRTIKFGINANNPSNWARCKEVLFVWKHLTKVHFHAHYATDNYDVIHNFGRLLYLLPVLHQPAMKIMSYQRQITLKNIRIINALKPKNLLFTACSDNCRKFSVASEMNVQSSRLRRRSNFTNWRTIYNAVDFSKYQPTYKLQEDAPLIFLGRLEQIKGVHLAIQVAKKTNRTLWIAGNIPERPDATQYYEHEIRRHVDGIQIIYLGELDDSQKNHYLSRSAALLFPIQWEEPFGIVMIEAMACGTPVIALNRGSVPEVITPGETGFIVHDTVEMCSAVQRIDGIDRLQCRYAAMAKFDINVIAGQYLVLTRNKVNSHQYKPTTKQSYV